MAKYKDRERALALRIQGLSYSQIKETLKVSKSTLSLWLRDHPLSRERINELRAHSEKRIERFRETMRRKREDRLAKVYGVQKKLLLPLTDKELLVSGLFLYLGERSKTSRVETALANTNPLVIKFFIRWLKENFNVPEDKIKIRLHLYNDMSIKNEIDNWIKITELPEQNFLTPYIKNSSSERINYRGTFGHGTCNVLLRDVQLTEKILMSIKVLLDKYAVAGV